MKLLGKSVIGHLLLIAISSAQLYGQSSPHVWLGGFAGLDIGNLSVTGNDNTGTTFYIGSPYSSKTGFAFGAEFDDFFSDNYGICVQLAYVQKGTTASFNYKAGGVGNTLGTFRAGLTFSYIQIPVLFKATFGSGSWKPVLFAGPEIGFKLSARGIGHLAQDTTIIAADNAFTTVNLGIMFGAGVTYEINRTTMLFLNAAYDLGLSNLNAHYIESSGATTANVKEITTPNAVTPPPPEASTANLKEMTRDIRINVGILFGLGN